MEPLESTGLHPSSTSKASIVAKTFYHYDKSFYLSEKFISRCGKHRLETAKTDCLRTAPLGPIAYYRPYLQKRCFAPWQWTDPFHEVFEQYAQHEQKARRIRRSPSPFLHISCRSPAKTYRSRSRDEGWGKIPYFAEATLSLMKWGKIPYFAEATLSLMTSWGLSTRSTGSTAGFARRRIIRPTACIDSSPTFCSIEVSAGSNSASAALLS